MVKFVSATGSGYRIAILSIDVFGIGFSLASVYIMRTNENFFDCAETLNTTNNLLITITVYGFLIILRMMYFIYPHWTGATHFRRKEQTDLATQKTITVNVPIYMFNESFLMDKGKDFQLCKMCLKEFTL